MSKSKKNLNIVSQCKKILPLAYKNKALHIIHKLHKGKSYLQFKGKRIRRRHSVISIPIGRRFRLVCTDIGGKIIPQSIMSHEKYNHFLKHSI